MVVNRKAKKHQYYVALVQYLGKVSETLSFVVYPGQILYSHMQLFCLIYTVWHEKLTVIKFYGLSKLLREKESTDFKFYGIKAT